MPLKRSSPHTLLGLLLIGDCAVCVVGLTTALWLRFFTPLRSLGFAIESNNRFFVDYVSLLALGTVLLIGTFFYLNLYDARLLLRPHRAFAIILKGIFFWFCVFLGTSLALKFEPAVSRLFVLLSTVTTLICLMIWRYGLYNYISHSRHRDGLTQRVAILGWTKDAEKLSQAIASDMNHPYEVIGLIESTTPLSEDLTNRPFLGQLDQLENILQEKHPDILVVADLDMPRNQIEHVTALCERHYIAFKIIPSFFQIFISNLHLQTISGVSILGVESLPLDSLANRVLKRAIDIFGALIGLLAAAPVVAILAILIRRESPGPVFFAQERVGHGGRSFRMWKLRSMVSGAHLRDNEFQSTLRQDERITHIGAYMRRNNLDELPQFWNILRGDMSLVGPRPERSYHVKQLSSFIPHYNPRHVVLPGLSGWAQINGLRGDTNLVERVKYDLYYIENWSVWLDIQIILLTFVRKENAY